MHRLCHAWLVCFFSFVCCCTAVFVLLFVHAVNNSFFCRFGFYSCMQRPGGRGAVCYGSGAVCPICITPPGGAPALRLLVVEVYFNLSDSGLGWREFQKGVRSQYLHQMQPPAHFQVRLDIVSWLLNSLYTASGRLSLSNAISTRRSCKGRRQVLMHSVKRGHRSELFQNSDLCHFLD